MSEIIEWGCIYDYLNWWGNLSFEQVPFNDVYSLILSELSYISCDDYIKENMTIGELSLYCQNALKDAKSEFSLIYESTNLVQILNNYSRFKDISIIRYCNDIDYCKEKQFSAMTFVLPQCCLYIAFRGTDDTILGWKEDFNMIYREKVPSQEEAVKYTEQVIKDYKIILNKKGHFFKYPHVYLAGHSKGGNLAIYAGVKLDRKIKKYVKKIYNFDGPGFNQSFLKTTEYQEMKDKIITFRPQGSVIGGLLYHDCRQIIVSSFSHTMMQHSGFTWKIKADKFKVCDQLDERCIKINDEINKILESMDNVQKESFVNEFFELLNQSNIKMVCDITENKLNKLITGMKGFKNMSSVNRTISLTLLKYMLLLEGKHLF